MILKERVADRHRRRLRHRPGRRGDPGARGRSRGGRGPRSGRPARPRGAHRRCRRAGVADRRPMSPTTRRGAPDRASARGVWPDRHPAQSCRRAGRGHLEQVAPAGFDRSWELNVRSHFQLARLVDAAYAGAGRRLDPQHVVEFRRALRSRDDRLHDDQARRHRHDAADRGSTTAATTSASTRSAPAGWTRPSTTPSRARWAAARRSRPISATRSRWAAGPASTRSPRRSCSSCRTARPT